MVEKLKICLTGATGFIGSNLLKELSQNPAYEIIALSRKIPEEMHNAKKENITWRRCNGFSIIDVQRATEDADILIYLIHSMLPSTSLTQGNFSDYDLYMADNFARAAATNGIKKIFYLGGLIPEDKKLSTHLKSRLEVESVLAQYNNDLTTLRAGLIVGPNGSSFTIMEKLLKRLPILICPAWTNSMTSPIDLRDVIELFKYCLNNYTQLNSVYDITGDDTLSYKNMLELTAKSLGKKRTFISVPLLSPALSKLWVSKVTGTSTNLVYPLIESLKHEITGTEKLRLKIPGHKFRRFEDSLNESLSKDTTSWVRTIIDYSASLNFSWLKNVSSIQRFESKRIVTNKEFAELYFNWLPKFLNPIMSTRFSDTAVHFLLFNQPVIKLTRAEHSLKDSRALFYITGGSLSNPKPMNGRVEFRYIESTNCYIIALLDFRPALPWFIYKYSQAIVHLIVMNRFRRYVKRFN